MQTTWAPAAYLSLVLALALGLGRPRLGSRFRFGPVSASALGVLLMFLAGALRPADVGAAAGELWRPFVGVASIVVTASVAQRLGILDRLAHLLEPTTRGPVRRAFGAVFLLAAATSALLNNDAAVLVLTPLVVSVMRRLYPLRPYLVPVFAFAVFCAAGVAPLVTSNPMNLVVATYLGIGFNEYALRMVPVALVSLGASFLALRIYFRAELDDAVPARGPEHPAPPFTSAAKVGALVFALTLGSYPVVSYLGLPVWLVAGCGALALTLTCWAGRIASPSEIARGVSWDILAFLFLVFLLVTGLRHAGAVEGLASLYALGTDLPGARIGLIGIGSAVGSALLNNHPMALLNALALKTLPGLAPPEALAALVGGDLGPRFLPMGSLAGLLWLEALRREGVPIGLGRFLAVGFATTVPAAGLGLFALWLQALGG